MSFKDNYKNNILPALAKELGIDNPMNVPHIEKIVLNMGIGTYVASGNKDFSSLKSDLALIGGQLPRINHARKAISNFKLREGNAIGAKVTLRGDRMYEFLDRFVTIALPRVKDFRGLKPTSFDGRGNFNMGVKEQIIFPEIDFDAVDAIRGMDIAITTTAKTDAEAKALLAAFKFPFRN